MKFPKHEAALMLCHNDHKNSYMSVSEAIANEDHGYTNWVSEEQKQKAIQTNDCWYIQWYPDTPVGSYDVAAADLYVLLEYVNNEDNLE
jgi:hypothetical protein